MMLIEDKTNQYKNLDLDDLIVISRIEFVDLCLDIQKIINKVQTYFTIDDSYDLLSSVIEEGDN